MDEPHGIMRLFTWRLMRRMDLEIWWDQALLGGSPIGSPVSPSSGLTGRRFSESTQKLIVNNWPTRCCSFSHSHFCGGWILALNPCYCRHLLVVYVWCDDLIVCDITCQCIHILLHFGLWGDLCCDRCVVIICDVLLWCLWCFVMWDFACDVLWCGISWNRCVVIICDVLLWCLWCFVMGDLL